MAEVMEEQPDHFFALGHPDSVLFEAPPQLGAYLELLGAAL